MQNTDKKQKSENKDSINADTETVYVKGSGEILADKRKSLGLSLSEIALKLNLSEAQLMAIELDQTEGLPEPTYVRGYIRSYSTLLGLSPEEVLEHYRHPNWESIVTYEDLPKNIENSMDMKIRITKSAVVLFILAVLALFAYGGYKIYLSYQDNTVLQESTPPTVTPSPTTTPSKVEEEGTSIVEPGSVNQIRNNSGSLSKNMNTLVLRFKETTWVDATDAENSRLAYKSYKAGEELTLSSDGEIRVFIGNAEGLEAEFNGAPLDLSPYKKDNNIFIRFVVGK